MINYKLFALLSILSLNLVDYALPKRIIILRHGEDAGNSCGNLSANGIKRANNIANFFKKKPDIVLGQIPAACFACEPRTIETIYPTACILPQSDTISYQHVNVYYGLNVENFGLDKIRQDTVNLIPEILHNLAYQDKILIVCWEHMNIQFLCQGLGVSQAPGWDANTYNEFWVITYNDGKVDFQIIKQGF